MYTRRILVRAKLTVVFNCSRHSSKQDQNKTNNNELLEKIKREINEMQSFKRKRSQELKSTTNGDTHHPLSLFVISNGYLGTAKSCVLATTEANYLINCGENACRLMNHDGHLLKKTRNVFISQFNHVNTAGLMSMSLECASYEWPITVHTRVDLNLRSKANSQQNCKYFSRI